MSATLVRYIGYGIGILGLAIAVLFTIPIVREWRVIDSTIAISWGMNLIAIAFALIAISIAKDSDRRMTAMSNLEFYEKISMLQSYIACLSEADSKDQNEAEALRVFYDLVSARQLEEWMKDDKLVTEFRNNVQQLSDKAQSRRKCEMYSKLGEFLSAYKS